MAESEPEDRGFRKIVPLTRVQLLTDALFALSMMIILMQVDYPDPQVVTSNEQIRAFLADQLCAIEVYAITFILIAIYWVKHMEEFSYIREIDYRLLWLQLGFLLFLVLLPVFNAYATLYPLNQTVFISYGAVLLGMGVFSAMSWRYATKGGRLLNRGLDPQVVDNLWLDTLIEPITAAIAMALRSGASNLARSAPIHFRRFRRAALEERTQSRERVTQIQRRLTYRIGHADRICVGIAVRFRMLW